MNSKTMDLGTLLAGDWIYLLQTVTVILPCWGVGLSRAGSRILVSLGKRSLASALIKYRLSEPFDLVTR